MPTSCINFPTTNLPSHSFHNIRKTETLSPNSSRILSCPTSPILLNRNCRLNCLLDPTTTVFPPKNFLSTMDKTQNLEIEVDDKYSKELEVAVKAVHMACLLCERHSMDDDFPVIIAGNSV